MSKQSSDLKVTVSSPDEVIWEGTAQSVSSENNAGPFDVLSGHANFVTIIRNKPITIRARGARDNILTYKSAVLAVKEGEVKIYADV